MCVFLTAPCSKDIHDLLIDKHKMGVKRELRKEGQMMGWKKEKTDRERKWEKRVSESLRKIRLNITKLWKFKVVSSEIQICYTVTYFARYSPIAQHRNFINFHIPSYWWRNHTWLYREYLAQSLTDLFLSFICFNLNQLISGWTSPLSLHR